jgi:hypothetical protein
MKIGPVFARGLAMALGCVAATAAAPHASSGTEDGERVRLTLRDDSRLWLEGDSNVRHWSCGAARLIPELILQRPASPPAVTRLTGAIIRIPVAGIDCGQGRMNRDLRATLREAEHPEITFAVSGIRPAELGAVHQRGRVDVIARTCLTVAGVSKPIELQLTGFDTGDGALRVSGEIEILMTEFGIEPPTALFGLIKARNRVTIRFDLTAGYDSIEEVLGS